MVNRMKYFLSIILLFTTSIFPDAFSIGIFTSKNKGEQMDQVVNSLPNAFKYSDNTSTFYDYATKGRNGSTIIFDRNYQNFGLSLGYEKNQFEWNGNLYSSMKTVASGRGIDNDYNCNYTCYENNSGLKVSPSTISFKDTIYFENYDSKQAYLVSKGRSTLYENGATTNGKYFFSSTTNPEKINNGLYFLIGFNHTYTKYNYSKDITVYAPNLFPSEFSKFYFTPYTSIAIQYKRMEIPLGLGYRKLINQFQTDFHLSYLNGREYLEDNHFHRLMRSKQVVIGNGFQYKISLDKIFSEGSYLAGFSIYGHRFFSTLNTLPQLQSGKVYGDYISSSYSNDEIKKTFLRNSLISSSYRHTGIKEWGIEFHVIRRFIQ